MTVAWVNFRSTLAGPTGDGFPGDGGASTYNLGDVYPVSGRKIGGVYDQGFVASNVGNCIDLTGFAAYVVNEHMGGRAALTALVDAANFKIGGITNGHQYKIYMCGGAITAGPISTGYTICGSQYGTTILETNVASLASGSLIDAAGNTFANRAAWEAGQTSVTITANSTEFWITKGIGSGNSMYLEALGIEDITGGGGGSASASPLLMMGV